MHKHTLMMAAAAAAGAWAGTQFQIKMYGVGTPLANGASGAMRPAAVGAAAAVVVAMMVAGKK